MIRGVFKFHGEYGAVLSEFPNSERLGISSGSECRCERKKVKKRYPYLWAAIYGVFLTGYAVFTLLDTFVLPRDMVYLEDITGESATKEMVMDYGDSKQDTEETSLSEISESKEETEPIITDTSYESAGISISITIQREYDTEIYNSGNQWGLLRIPGCRICDEEWISLP